MNKTMLLASMGMWAVATSTLALADVREHRADQGAALLSGHGNGLIQRASPSRKHGEHADRDTARDHREHNQRTGPDDGIDQGMQAVPTTAGPGQPGDGWLYFSHPAAHRAVVISPQGEYHLSRGKGLRWVAATQQ